MWLCFQQEDVDVVDVVKNPKCSDMKALQSLSVVFLEHWTCFISELFTIYLNISHIQNRYNRLCVVICLREKERERDSGRLLKKKRGVEILRCQ